MNRHPLVAAVLIALLACGTAAAEKGKKLYRWVDKDGKVQYSEVLPPEAVDQARREFSEESGTAIGSVDRALTADERAAQATAAATAAELAAQEEEKRRQEQAMLASYETEADLSRSFDDRVDLLKRTVEGIEASISGQRTSLLGQLESAAESELAGNPVDAKRAQMIRELHDELIKHHEMLMRREAELGALNQEYERTLARYRELREGERAKTEAEATNPAATPALEPTPSG